MLTLDPFLPHNHFIPFNSLFQHHLRTIIHTLSTIVFLFNTEFHQEVDVKFKETINGSNLSVKYIKKKHSIL